MVHGVVVQIKTEAPLRSGEERDGPLRSGNFTQALTNKTLGTDPLGRPILENTIYDPATDRLVNGLRAKGSVGTHSGHHDRERMRSEVARH